MLCQRVVDESKDETDRSKALALLSAYYMKSGNTNEAIKIANSMTDIMHSNYLSLRIFVFLSRRYPIPLPVSTPLMVPAHRFENVIPMIKPAIIPRNIYSPIHEVFCLFMEY